MRNATRLRRGLALLLFATLALGLVGCDLQNPPAASAPVSTSPAYPVHVADGWTFIRDGALMSDRCHNIQTIPVYSDGKAQRGGLTAATPLDYYAVTYIAGDQTLLAIADNRANLVTGFVFDHISYRQGDCFIGSQKGKYGAVDAAGNVVIPFAYFAPPVMDDVGKTALIGADMLFIAAGGRVALDAGAYDQARPFAQDMAAVERAGKWGFVDRAGTLVIPCRYDEVLDFSGGTAAVRRDDLWGYVDTAGNLLATPAYAGARSFAGGYAVAQYVNGSYLYLDAACSPLTDGSFVTAGDFAYGNAAVSGALGNGFLNAEGAFTPFAEGALSATPIAEGRFVAKATQAQAPATGQVAGQVTEQAGAVRQTLYGLLGGSGDWLTSPQYTLLRWGTNDLLIAQKDGKEGLIDLDGNVVLDFAYDHIDSTDGAAAFVMQGNTQWWVDVATGAWLPGMP